MRTIVLTVLIFPATACIQNKNVKQEASKEIQKDSVMVSLDSNVKVEAYAYNSQIINTGNTTPQRLLDYAKTLIGTPYKYGSTDPAVGFDCSGFITYVFNHFHIAVPRSSIDFTYIKNEVKLQQAKPGDLILFTGTDSTIREVGHMGIINTVDSGGVSFIHSTSGKMNGVTITPLNEYYMGRFMKVIRVSE